jgi:hypothetical protein
MPLLHSGPFQRLFSSVCPFWVSCSTMSLVECFLTKFPLHCATPAQWVIFLPVVADSFRGPQLPWVQIFLKTFLLHPTTLAWQDTFLQAAANFFRDLQFPQVTSFGSPCHPAARCRPLCCCFIDPEDFTAASSKGASRCSTSDLAPYCPDTPPSLLGRTLSLLSHTSFPLSRH